MKLGSSMHGRFRKIASIFIIAIVCAGCNSSYRSVLDAGITPAIVQNRHEYLTVYAAKSEYSKLPDCSQFLASNHNVTIFRTFASDFSKSYTAGKERCERETGQECFSVYSEKRNFCEGQGGACSPRISTRIMESSCFINWNKEKIAFESRVFAAKAEEEKREATIGSWRSECTKMGFSAHTTEFSNCILSLKEIAARAEIHERARMQYETTLAQIRREREEDTNLRLMQFGLGMAAGGRSGGSYSGSRSLPTLPPPPPPLTIIAPSGNRYNCSSFGTTVTCR